MVFPFDLGGENVLVEIGTIHNDWPRSGQTRIGYRQRFIRPEGNDGADGRLEVGATGTQLDGSAPSGKTRPNTENATGKKVA